MGRHKKILPCPYREKFCDGDKKDGDMMCRRCYDDAYPPEKDERKRR